MSTRLKSFSLIIIFIVCVFYSCNKSTPAPTSNTTSISYNLNGKSYSTSTQINITNPFANFSSTVPVTNGYSVAQGYTTIAGSSFYGLLLSAGNVASSDTSGIVVGFFSNSPLTTGDYTIYPVNLLLNLRESYTLPISAGYGAYYETSVSGRNLETATAGTVTISSIDNTNKKVSGSFSYTVSFTNPKTSLPTSVNVSNGVFSNLSVQQF